MSEPMSAPLSETSAAHSADAALFVPHAEFCRGLPAGHFKLVVNPQLARIFIRQRLMLMPMALTIAGVGIALALTGQPWWGLGLVVVAVAVNRLIRHQAAKIMLQLATSSEPTYHEVMAKGILEVRRAV